MKKSVFTVILAILLPVAAFGAEREIKKGDSIQAEIVDVAEVKNLEPIKNATKAFYYGDRCHLSNGGTLTAIAVDGKRVLVRYFAGEESNGSICPGGTIFFYSKQKFLKALESDNRQKLETEKEKELIKKLLGQ